MRLAVVVATYERPHYLRRCLEGYLHQHQPPAELVVADDGSGEATRALVAEIAAAAPFPVRHVWHEDRGFRVAAIRNRAVAATEAEYLVFTDDDCIPAPRFVADHRAAAEAGCLVQGHRVLVGERAAETFSWRDLAAPRLLRWALAGELGNVKHCLRLPRPLVRRSTSLRGIRTCNLALWRADFLAVNGFNEAFEGWGKEDSELVVRLFRHGVVRKDVRFQAAVFHLHHPEFDRGRLERNLRLLEEAKASGAVRCEKGVDQYLGTGV
ncbi:MAG: glycosyltransferase [Nitrospirae bacterium]|nr:MAG: glycosyltransferase [Nitrospirota bacterium]